AGCFDQAVEGVVFVGVRRFDDRVGVVDGLLRGVADIGDVAGRIVMVVQALERGLVGSTNGGQVRQSVGLRIVGVDRRCRRRIGGAVDDGLTLAAGVVGYVPDHRLRDLAPAVAQLDALQSAAFIVGVG